MKINHLCKYPDLQYYTVDYSKPEDQTVDD